MIDSLTSRNYADFRQRYKDTFGFLLQKNNEKQLVFMRDTTEESAHFLNKHNISCVANANAGVSFEFIPVSMGCYNTKDDVVFVSRVPATQYKRGISKTNTSIVSLTSSRSIALSFAILEEIFNTKYDVAVRVEEYKNKGTPVAISRNFALVESCLYFNHVEVGSYNKNIISVESICFQEVSDTVRRQGLPFIVEEEHE